MKVDYPRVTHPFAGLLILADFLPRLACVRHAASVRSEPGSNSPIIILVLVLLSRPHPSARRMSRVLHSKHCAFPQSLRGSCSSVFKDQTAACSIALLTTDCGAADFYKPTS